MYKLSAAITLGALLTIRAFAQAPASNGPFGAFEASVLAGLDRQVDAQKNTLAALRAAAHEALFDFSTSQTITGTITVLTLANSYSVLTVNASGVLTHMFLASANALAAGGWIRGTVKPGDQITQRQALFSRPTVELSRDAIAAYEK